MMIYATRISFNTNKIKFQTVKLYFENVYIKHYYTETDIDVYWMLLLLIVILVLTVNSEGVHFKVSEVIFHARTVLGHLYEYYITYSE